MFKFNLIGLVLIFVLSSSAFAQKPENTSTLNYDAQLSEYKYDFEVNYFRIDSQGQVLKMAYIYLQVEKNNHIVTLMHGKNFNADYWTSTARYLHKQGYSVLIPDQIGFGKSSKPMHYQYSFASLAHHTHALMNSLNIEKSIVMGHSMGGMLASRFTLM